MITAFATASPLTAFLGPIGGPEMIMIFVVLVLLTIPASIAVLLTIYFRSKNQSPPTAQQSAQQRLREIDHLRAQNLITAEEHEAKRRQILAGL